MAPAVDGARCCRRRRGVGGIRRAVGAHPGAPGRHAGRDVAMPLPADRLFHPGARRRSRAGGRRVAARRPSSGTALPRSTSSSGSRWSIRSRARSLATSRSASATRRSSRRGSGTSAWPPVLSSLDSPCAWPRRSERRWCVECRSCPTWHVRRSLPRAWR